METPQQAHNAANSGGRARSPGMYLIPILSLSSHSTAKSKIDIDSTAVQPSPALGPGF